MADTSALKSQIAALTAQLTVQEEGASMKAHFFDEDGNAYTNPTSIDDGMLRSMGIAMEARAKNMAWQDRPVDDLNADLASAVRAQDFVAVALYAAMLNAKTAMAAA